MTHPRLRLVSCATYDEDRNEKMVWWLCDRPKRQRELANYLKQYEFLIGYAFVAEARAMLALDLDPVNWKIIDMFLEYRMLTNHNDTLQWGKQLVDGKVRNTHKPKPKWERSEEDGETGFKASHSLAEATYKLTGQIRDTEEKTEVRNLIISDPESFRPEEIKRILRYNMEDVVFLPEIWKRCQEEFRKLDDTTSLATYRSEAIIRGRYSALTAKMEARGYPINVKATRNFSRQVPHILMECQRDINAQFPDAKPFRWNKKPSNFSWDQKVTRAWIEENCDTKFWMKTDGGKKKQPQLSLSLEAWEKQFQFKHTYPRENFGAQMVRFLKLRQSLYGFSETGGKRKNFWDSFGPDNRVRPYMNIFGAQSSRSQPAASGFMFLKPAWMRSLVLPEPGKFMFGIDYGQQEFFLSALVSEDQNMIDAYLSGDPYLWGAKAAGAIPQNATKKTHGIERDLFKNTYLGILYGMTKYGLAIKLTGDTGRVYTEDDAQEQIDLFEEMFPDYMEWKYDIANEYGHGAVIKLPCVAEGTLITTDSGDKCIEDVKRTDKIWDGFEWHSHTGVLQKGAKAVIRDRGVGLTATPDHLVLCGGVWRAWLEVLADAAAMNALRSERFSGDGRLLAANSKSRVGAMSLVGAYVELKKTLELNHCSLGALKPVLSALNLCAPKLKEPSDLAAFLMTNIFEDGGSLVTAMQREGARTVGVQTSNGMVLAALSSASSALENSWNILLHWMGIGSLGSQSIELIMTDTMRPETYESLLTQRVIEIKETFDIGNAGPLNRFQAGKTIVHNCGWRMFGDNDNMRSVMNVPIQGFGASVMRNAVYKCDRRDVPIVFTLHDALYGEDSVKNLHKVGVMHDAMKEAFKHYFKRSKYADLAGEIKLDPCAWSPDFEPDSEFEVDTKLSGRIKVPSSNLYIDERSTSEWDMFKKYFDPPDTDLL